MNEQKGLKHRRVPFEHFVNIFVHETNCAKKRIYIIPSLVLVNKVKAIFIFFFECEKHSDAKLFVLKQNVNRLNHKILRFLNPPPNGRKFSKH